MKKVAHFFRWSPEFSLLISDLDFGKYGKCYKHLNQRPLCSSPSRNIRCFNSILIRAYKSLSSKLTKVKQLWNLWKCRKWPFFCKCCNSYGSAELCTHTIIIMIKSMKKFLSKHLYTSQPPLLNYIPGTSFVLNSLDGAGTS